MHPRPPGRTLSGRMTWRPPYPSRGVAGTFRMYNPCVLNGPPEDPLSHFGTWLLTLGQGKSVPGAIWVHPLGRLSVQWWRFRQRFPKLNDLSSPFPFLSSEDRSTGWGGGFFPFHKWKVYRWGFFLTSCGWQVAYLGSIDRGARPFRVFGRNYGVARSVEIGMLLLLD